MSELFFKIAKDIIKTAASMYKYYYIQNGEILATDGYRAVVAPNNIFLPDGIYTLCKDNSLVRAAPHMEKTLKLQIPSEPLECLEWHIPPVIPAFRGRRTPVVLPESFEHSNILRFGFHPNRPSIDLGLIPSPLWDRTVTVKYRQDSTNTAIILSIDDCKIYIMPMIDV